MTMAQFRKCPLMGILRGVSEEALAALLEAILKSGLRTLEITMNTPKAEALIKKTVKRHAKDFWVGAGTVLTLRDLETALDAGARFIVTPVLIKDVTAYCVRHRIPVFPGALAPQHIYEAWQAGATMVKVFPSNCFGPEYFREIKGPFKEIELMACAGVTPENLGDYFACGASAAAVGSSVFRKDWIEAKQFSKITARLKAYLRALPLPHALRSGPG